MSPNQHSHFQGKSPQNHILFLSNILNSLNEEKHVGGPVLLQNFFQDIKQTVASLWFVKMALYFFKEDASSFFILLATGFSLMIWQVLQKTWRQWAQIELSHKWISQEKLEIANNYEQEKEELYAIYKMKGFEGELLDAIVDYISSDSNLLLKSMIEDELGLSLESVCHPFKIFLFSLISGLLTLSIFLVLNFFFSFWVIFSSSLLMIGGSSILLAFSIKSDSVSSCIWNISIFSLATGLAFLLYQIFIK